MSEKESTKKPTTDRVLRAMTNDGAFRVMTVRSTDLARAWCEQVSPPEAMMVPVCNLLAASIVYRETMAPTLRVQCFLRSAGDGGTIIADSHPEGWARAMMQLPKGAEAFSLSSQEGQTPALLQMNRALPNGELNRGVVEVPDSNISEAVIRYMQLSEQIVTMARFDTVVEGGRVVASGGYLVQLLPEAPDREGAVHVMAQRLEDDFSDLRTRLMKTDADPNELMNEILYGMEFTELGDSGVRLDCDCSKERVLGSLATLGREEIRTLIAEENALEMTCDWCDSTYTIDIETLRGLAEPS